VNARWFIENTFIFADKVYKDVTEKFFKNERKRLN